MLEHREINLGQAERVVGRSGKVSQVTSKLKMTGYKGLSWANVREKKHRVSVRLWGEIQPEKHRNYMQLRRPGRAIAMSGPRQCSTLENSVMA